MKYKFYDARGSVVKEVDAPPPGLGDRVAAVAQPIARALDRVLGTDIQHCGGCARRRAALNKLGEKLS